MSNARTTGRRLTLGFALILGLVTVAPAANAITQDEVVTLTKLGIAPTEIVKAIEKDRTVFELGVTDILALKKASVDESVIKFMLSTPQKFGSPSTPGGTPTTDPTPVAPTPVEVAETPEETAAREERLRQESLRLAEDQQKAEQAQREAFAQGVLAEGRQLADDGKFVESIQAFQRFMDQGQFTPDSDEAYFAKFGIANALVKSGLYQAAANQLVEVLLAGADRPFFQIAFEQLRELRKKVNYAPPDLEQLTQFFVTEFSPSFQDSFNYVLGEFYYDYNNWTKALQYLEQVGADSPDYAKAQYLKGLIEVRNQMWRSAVGSLQQAIIATEENESDPEVKDLAFLALARIAYEVGDYDGSIYYYRKIPEGSYKQATAYYESGWVYFQKGDFSRALGTFQTLHSPYFEHQFYPELWILEATAYVYVCQFDLAEKALNRYKKDIAPIGLPLKQFLLATVRPGDFYKAVVSSAAGEKRYNLPKEILPVVLGDVEFYNLHKTIKQIEGEIATLRKNSVKLGAIGDSLIQKLGALRADHFRAVGIRIQRILKETESALQGYSDKLTEIEIDLYDLKIEEDQRRLMELETGAEEIVEVEADKGGSAAIVGSDQWQWDFEGEYWRDEVGTYRAFVPNKCVPEAGR